MSTFIRLTNYDKFKEKEKNYHNINNKIIIHNQYIFSGIPGEPIAYWLNENNFSIFKKSTLLEMFLDIPGSQNITANNERYLRYFWEINYDNTGIDKNWVYYNKGGEYRKWYGNFHFVVDWSEGAKEYYKNNKTSNLLSENYRFKEGLTWTATTNKDFNCRYLPNRFIFDKKGPSAFASSDNDLYYFIGFLNCKVADFFLKCLSYTIDFQNIDVQRLPIIQPQENIKKTIISITKKSILLSKYDWDSRETSWDFTSNELLKHKNDSNKIQDAYNNYCDYWKNKFFELHKSEEELNKIFIDIYELQDELTPNVSLEDITILNEETKIQHNILVFKKEVLIKQFISYATGCILGRYSIDKDGLILANHGDNMNDFIGKVPNPRFLPDDDNIVPVIDDEYFTDDLFTRFKEFLNVSFGKESLYENLDFIADALDKRSNETSEQTIRRYFLNDFFKDHCKMYNNRPIYWYFTSGKEKAFNALIYMHRYNKELLAKMRIEYLIKLEEKLIAQKTHLDINTTDSKKKQQALSKQAELNKKIEEIRLYDEKLKHLADQYIEIDLDDGVKNNYKLFEEITAKI
jgi:type II restriction/modification system DNA methylase subunit YeeA